MHNITGNKKTRAANKREAHNDFKWRSNIPLPHTSSATGFKTTANRYVHGHPRAFAQKPGWAD
jgi:hypothetical protein